MLLESVGVPAAVAGSQGQNLKPTVILAHGAYAESSSWNAMVEPLVGRAVGIRNARLVTFATAGHAVYADERDKFNAELLQFIR